MTTLARAASKTIPGMTRLETNLASPSGFMVYESPIAESTGRIHGPSAAHTLEEGHGKLLADGRIEIPMQGFIWQTRAVNDPDDGSVRPGITIAYLFWVRHDCLYPMEWETLPFNEPVDTVTHMADGWGSGDVEPQFWTTQLLMQQTLAWTESARADRPERRRWVRAGHPPPPDIKVVKLRKMAKAPEHDQEQLVDWSHRWLVSGHWRQQYYPGTGTHRPLWISPHVKGPENRPLVVKDKVTAWVR